MRGKVTHISKANGLIAIETEYGEYVVFEPLGDYGIDLGDTISGNFDSLDDDKFINITKNEYIDVSVEDCDCDINRTIELLKIS